MSINLFNSFKERLVLRLLPAPVPRSVFSRRGVEIGLKRGRHTRFYIHADDFGLCREATERIMDCVDCGSLNSTSLMCNMPEFDHAVDMYSKIQDRVRMCVHLKPGRRCSRFEKWGHCGPDGQER